METKNKSQKKLSKSPVFKLLLQDMNLNLYKKKIQLKENLVLDFQNKIAEQKKLFKTLQHQQLLSLSNTNRQNTKNQDVILKKLENNIDRKKKDLSKFQSLNQEMIKKIDDLRKEKLIYQEILRKMERESKSEANLLLVLKEKEQKLLLKREGLSKHFKSLASNQISQQKEQFQHKVDFNHKLEENIDLLTKEIREEKQQETPNDIEQDLFNFLQNQDPNLEEKASFRQPSQSPSYQPLSHSLFIK